MQDKIIHFLKEADGHLSGEEISRCLNISRAGVWKYVQELRRQGYDIMAVPHLGYRLGSCPDKLLPVEIQYNLRTQNFGREIIYHESIDSTMEEAFRRAMEGAGEGCLVCAETQTKGKGRLGRSWCSPKGKGIYMSLILRPRIPLSEAAQLTLLSAVAVCEAVNKTVDVQARIKWPNDLLVQNRKLAGILTELSAEMDRVRFVIVGIGINVNTPLNMLPAQATSLKQEAGHPVSRVNLAREVLRCFESGYEQFKREGFLPVIRRWKELSSTLGRQVRISDPAGSVEGEAVDLDSDGGLIIRNRSGINIKRMAGDVLQR